MQLLLVESYGLLARSLRSGLEEEGFVVTSADDSDEAKELLCSGTYDVILLDLPPRDELAVLRGWRQSRIATPVLFLSIPESQMNDLNDLGLGPGAVLSKPFQFEHLLAQVRFLGEQGLVASRIVATGRSPNRIVGRMNN